MGLLLLTGFALLLLGSLARWRPAAGRRRLSILWCAAASLVVLLVLLGQLPRGF
jgi:hypothetical protein